VTPIRLDSFLVTAWVGISEERAPKGGLIGSEAGEYSLA